MARKSNTFTVLQFDERLIVALRAERADKGVHLAEIVREYGEWTTEAELLKALKEFVKKNRLTAEPLYSVLPRHDVTARILVLPTLELGEVASMIRLSAEEYMPYPVEDLVINQAILQRNPDGTSRVLAVLAHRDVLERHVRLLREAGVVPEKTYLSTTCLATAATLASRGDDERYALVNLSSGGVEVLIMNGARIEYGRGVDSHRNGGLPDQPIEGLLEELALEVRASLAAYRRESEEGEPVDKIYLCSEWADASSLAEHLAAETGHECLPAPFAQTLVTRGADKLTASPLSLMGAALAVQGRATLAIDLVPLSLAETRAAASRKRILISAAITAAVVLASLGAWFAQAVYLRSAYIAELEEQAAALRPEAESVASKLSQLKILQRQVDRSGGALETLARVTELAPEKGLTIIQFTYDRGQKLIEIQGRATTYAEIDEFTTTLRAEGGPLFADARQGVMKSVKEQNGTEATEYTILIPFPATAVEDGESGEIAEATGGEETLAAEEAGLE